MNIEYKYPNAVIYDIFYQNRRLYTGSSINFPKRKLKHKSDYNKNGTSLYIKMKEENINFEDLQFIIYKEYPCNDIKDLHKIEENCIKELKPEFNTKMIGETKKECYKNNKKKILEYERKQYEINKEKAREKSKRYYENNKEIVKEKCRNYKDQNKELIKIKNAEYRKERILCECGTEISKGNKFRHELTKKHKNFIENKNISNDIIKDDNNIQEIEN